MGLTVNDVRDRRSLREFLDLPFVLYAGDRHWVPPLRAEVKRVLDVNRNPYFRGASLRLFLCRDGKLPVARVAVIINRLHEKKFGVRSAFFGFFESVNDQAVADALFAEVTRYCRRERASLLEGPFNPNHYSELGLQVSGFDTDPSFFQTYNPPWYSSLLEECGFALSAEMFTAKNSRIGEYVRERYGNGRCLRSVDGFSVRSFRMDDMEAELGRLREVFNDAFSSNWHYLPSSEDEYAFSSKFLKYVTEPNLIQIGEYRGEPVAVMMFVLDINPALKKMDGRFGPLKYLRFQREKRDIRELVIYAIGIKKAYQRTRIFPLLLDSACDLVQGYDTLETTWMMPGNVLVTRAASRLGLEPDKRYVIYEKLIAP